jgi:hypothetical protein
MDAANTKNDTLFILILVLLCLALFFPGLGARPLWDTDEGMHAATSKEMVLSGDWITTTFNGRNFYDKPIRRFCSAAWKEEGKEIKSGRVCLRPGVSFTTVCWSDEETLGAGPAAQNLGQEYWAKG